jgi:hypothetical protein
VAEAMASLILPSTTGSKTIGSASGIAVHDKPPRQHPAVAQRQALWHSRVAEGFAVQAELQFSRYFKVMPRPEDESAFAHREQFHHTLNRRRASRR